MSKEGKVRALTIAVLGLAFVLVIGRQMDLEFPGIGAAGTAFEAATESKPLDIVYQMLESAQEGDVEAYLTCYSGPMEQRLQRTRDEMSSEGFSRYLIERNLEIKGIAISEPVALSESEVQVRVEYVYQDRNEAQQFRLRKSAGDWKIFGVGEVERVETLVPYGTPVY